jgi:putative nucleotidyltransferase with HDIG domain
LRICATDTPVVAQLIRARRAEIGARVLTGAMRRREATVGWELLALSFVDRFADALETSTWVEFLGWIDTTCDKYGGAAPVARLLTSAPTTIVDALDSAGGGPALRAAIGPLAERIRQIAERPRQAPMIGAHQSLNEIDVALDRLMSQLTNFDPATADHSRAVSRWCARIGKKIGLSPAETTFVTRCGLIHDIGKVMTPPEILNAPHRLSDSDMAIMRQHAAAGAAIVSEIPLLAHLTSTVRGHHERIDGLGYPDGRTAAEIPLAVRIVSVADSFNAMIGNRPYRLPMPPTVALEQLRLHTNTQFDANVVAAMIEVVAPPR